MATPIAKLPDLNLIRYDDLDIEDIFQNAENMTPEQIQRALDVDAIDEDGLQAYIGKYALTSIRNGRLMVAWCREADVPCVLYNLEVARGELQAQGRWENEGAEPKAPKVVAKKIVTRAVEAAQVAQPTPEEAKFLKKVADNPLASDTTRKKNDAELKRAAYAQRFANRTSSPTPTVVI